MTRFIPERPGVIAKMEKDQMDARKGECPEPEILCYLVDVYHPSHRELRTVRSAGTLRNYIPINERMLMSDKMTHREINRFNRDQRLLQEIGSTREEWPTISGKVRIVWVKVLLIAKDIVLQARGRNRRMIIGGEQKDIRLADILRNPRKRRRDADATNALVRAAIRRGRRRP